MKYNIYFNDDVNSMALVANENSFEDAKAWVDEDLNNRVMLDEDHPCSDDVYSSAAVAHYEIYKGEPGIIKGEPDDAEAEYNEPVYISEEFYVN